MSLILEQRLTPVMALLLMILDLASFLLACAMMTLASLPVMTLSHLLCCF